MSYNVNAISIKVKSFFENLKCNNILQSPSILYTYGKQFNIFNKEKSTTNIDRIISNINCNVNERNNNIVVLDSSFNPPTLAHIKLLNETFNSYCEQLLNNNNNKNNNFNYSNPIFLLLITNNNVDKKLTGANISQRLQMMEIASNIFQNQITSMANEKYQNLKDKINDIKILVGLTNVGRFIDKVIAVKQYIPNAKPSFIMGLDTITRFFMEKYYVGMDMKKVLDDFFNECNIICADRIMYEENKNSKNSNKNENELNNFIKNGPAKLYANNIFILNNWLDDKNTCKISSSEARDILKENYNNQGKLQTVLPQEIINFILNENIYK